MGGVVQEKRAGEREMWTRARTRATGTCSDNTRDRSWFWWPPPDTRQGCSRQPAWQRYLSTRGPKQGRDAGSLTDSLCVSSWSIIESRSAPAVVAGSSRFSVPRERSRGQAAQFRASTRPFVQLQNTTAVHCTRKHTRKHTLTGPWATAAAQGPPRTRRTQ